MKSYASFDKLGTKFTEVLPQSYVTYNLRLFFEQSLKVQRVDELECTKLLNCCWHATVRFRPRIPTKMRQGNIHMRRPQNGKISPWNPEFIWFFCLKTYIDLSTAFVLFMVWAPSRPTPTSVFDVICEWSSKQIIIVDCRRRSEMPFSNVSPACMNSGPSDRPTERNASGGGRRSKRR